MIKKLADLLKKLMYILDRPQKMWGVVVFALSIIGAFAEMLGVAVIIPLIQIMTNPDMLMQNEAVSGIVDKMGIESKEGMLILIVSGIIAVYIVKNLYLVFLSFVRCKYTCKIQRELSVKMMKFYMQRGYSFFTEHNSSELIRGVSSAPTSTYQILYNGLRLLADILTVGVLVGMSILIMDIKLIAIIFFLIIGCLLGIVFIFKNMTTHYGKKYHEHLGKSTQALYQALQGIKEVLVMNRQKHFTNEYEKAYTEQQKAVVGQAVATESPAYFIELVCIIGLLIYVALQCISVENADALLPGMASLAVGAFRILPALGRISAELNTMLFFTPMLQEVYDNFAETEKYRDIITDKPVAESLQDIKFEDNIAVIGVDWKYPNMETYVLKDINLTIRKGESIALIGASGAGKTTLADILLGLLIPIKGDILVDGESLYHSKYKWGKTIGFVSQAFYINDDTIRNNIAFGIEEDKIDDAKVWKALEQAQLKNFVEGLDKRLDTRVGERGVRFSGGQRQRLAIARALYEAPEILVLDEATAALDNDTETAVMEAVEHLKGRITLVIIAHRLTTIRNCDKVYEVKDGGILERDKDEVLEIGR